MLARKLAVQLHRRAKRQRGACGEFDGMQVGAGEHARQAQIDVVHARVRISQSRNGRGREQLAGGSELHMDLETDDGGVAGHSEGLRRWCWVFCW